MVTIIVRSWLAGLALGASVCFLKCALLLFPLVARFGRGWKQGLALGLAFGAGKALTYAVLAALVVFSRRFLEAAIGHPAVAWGAAAALAGMGAWFFWREEPCFSRPSAARLPVLLLGLVYGLLPCPPLLGFLLQLVYLESGVVTGALAGLAFGAGTITGPLLVLCGLFPLAGERLRRSRRLMMVFRAAGAAVFFWWAGRLAW